VPTSVTAFVGGAPTGPRDRPRRVTSFAAFERLYGGRPSPGPLSGAVQRFFGNGGREALICRVGGRGGEGSAISDEDVADPALEANRGGLWMLEHVDQFNILCIPPLAPGRDVGRATWAAAAAYARRRRAMLLVDPPGHWLSPADITPAGLAEIVPQPGDRANAAIYFPAILARQQTADAGPGPFAPSGAVAGVYARTDAAHGVWKAPAGVEALLVGAEGLNVALTERDIGLLNPRGVNCLRVIDRLGCLVWGARTLAGHDGVEAELKYVPVRRLLLFIEQSIERGTRWAVFEPNEEALWAELRLRVTSFMYDLFRRGAFQGHTVREAYFVKCDSETMTQADIDTGITNVLLGFAPLKPAEFVTLLVQHDRRSRT
jgi:uncharacterized protein